MILSGWKDDDDDDEKFEASERHSLLLGNLGN
jgi:hypothetical protein